MPRLIIRRKTANDTRDRAQRRSSYQSKGSKEWIDPFPHILGTEPEKRVYAILMQIGIGFNFQTWFRAKIPEVGFDKWYRPDFIIPSLKIIIEVQGAYFHSKPEQREQDAFKYAVYNQMGYKVLQWWDFEIERDVYALFRAEPRLAYYAGNFIGEIITKNKEVRDDSAGVRLANQRRRDYALSSPTINTRKSKRKGILSYDVGR